MALAMQMITREFNLTEQIIHDITYLIQQYYNLPIHAITVTQIYDYMDRKHHTTNDIIGMLSYFYGVFEQKLTIHNDPMYMQFAHHQMQHIDRLIDEIEYTHPCGGSQ